MVHGAAPAIDIGSRLRNGNNIDRLSHGASAIASAVMDGREEAEMLLLCNVIGYHNMVLCASSCVHEYPSVHAIF